MGRKKRDKKGQKPLRRIVVGDLKVKIEDIKLSHHAYENAIERFSLEETERNEVEKYIRNNLLESEYIGSTTCTDGNEGHMFVNGKQCYQLTLDLKTIYTVYTIDNKIPYSPIRSKLKEVMRKEFNKLDRREHAKLKRLELMEYEVASEISDLKLRHYKTKSQSVKLSCQARINALEISLSELREEIQQLKMDKRQVAKTLAPVV